MIFLLLVLGTGVTKPVTTSALPSIPPGADPIEDYPDLPLYEVVTATSDRRTTVAQGIVDHARRCMERAGFSWIPMATDPSPTRDRYGATDVEVARRFGYTDPNPIELDHRALAPPQDYLHAFVGDQDAGGHEVVVRAPDGSELGRFFRDGCLWEAESAIYGDWAEYEADRTILHGIANAAHRRARASAVVDSAMNEWSACMTGAGHEVVDIDDLHDGLLTDLRSRREGSTPSDAERALAVADATCNLATGLAHTWYAAEAAAQSQALATDRSMLDRYLAMLDAAVERSRSGT